MAPSPSPPPWDDMRLSNATDILQKKTTWFIGVEVENETKLKNLQRRKNNSLTSQLPSR